MLPVPSAMKRALWFTVSWVSPNTAGAPRTVARTCTPLLAVVDAPAMYWTVAWPLASVAVEA